MRINDILTFGSKPVLISQIDEILANKNVTMQGNNVNSPGGLLVLTNEGKIPENTDIQHIFYIGDAFPSADIKKNSLYVSSTGESRATDDNAEYINISLQVVADFSTVSDDTVATSQAIKTYVDNSIANIATGTSGVLSAYATTEYVDNKVANISTDVQHIFYVEDFPEVFSAVANSIYVNKNTKESRIFDGTEFASMSLETVTDFSTVSNDTLATTQAISSFVDEKISNIDIPSTDLSNYYNKTESDEKFALKDDVNSKLALSVVEDFPTSGINNTLYVNNENHAQIYANDQWKDIAIEVVENFDTPSQTTVPTTEAVSSFVDEKISNIDIPSTDLSNYYTKTEADDKFITSANIPEEVIYTSEFPTSGINNAIYVNDKGQSKIYANDNWIDMSLKVDTEITADAVSSVPTTKAVYDLVSSISGTHVDLTNYNGNVSLHTTNSEQGWMASYFVADGQKIQMEYTNAENNSFAIASSNFVGIGVYKTDGKESIEITNNNISISASNLTYNGFNTNTGNGLVELVDGKIPSGLYDTTNIPDNTLLVESVSDFPTSGTNNTMYITDSSEARIYTDGEWKNISIKAVENFDTPNQTTVPTTQAVKDYVETNKLNVNDYNNISKINFTNARVNLESTSGSIIDVDTSMNVENESIDNLGNPLILRGNFIGNSENTILLYTGDNTETVSNNITTLTNIALNKDYLGDVTSYNTSNILTYDNVPPIYGQNSEGHKSFGMDIYDKEMTIQYTNEFSEYVKVSYWYYISSTATIRGSAYFGLGSRNGGYYMGVFYYDVAYKKLRFFTRSDALSISFDSLQKDKWHYVELCFKLNAKNKAKVYHDGNYLGETTSDSTVGSWNNTDGKILFRSIIKDAFNFDQLMVNISSEEEYNNFENTEHPIPTSASEVIKSTSFVINDIDTVPEDGKLFIKSKNQTYTIQPSLISDLNSLSVDTFNKVKTLSFPNAKTYLDSDDDSKVIVEYPIANAETLGMVKVGDNLTVDDAGILNVNLSNYYTKTDSDNKYALKTEINNPEQKTEVTTNAITFKKDISIYKIEISQATTFTFDFSQLDENNCYTFELWVSMSTPVTLTFPSEAAWLNDEVPDMSEISTYCIVVRKLPSTMGTSTITSPKALLNLAYQYPLVLG